ncbi:unnamed protein product [Rhizophagus irregularis]|nr:unnamed protein product [Rhizophagus irregularis]
MENIKRQHQEVCYFLYSLNALTKRLRRAWLLDMSAWEFSEVLKFRIVRFLTETNERNAGTRPNIDSGLTHGIRFWYIWTREKSDAGSVIKPDFKDA